MCKVPRKIKFYDWQYLQPWWKDADQSINKKTCNLENLGVEEANYSRQDFEGLRIE